METGSEHFTFQNSGPSHIFKLIVFTSEEIVNNINLWYCEDKLNEKIAHFRLLSMYQDRRVLKLPNMTVRENNNDGSGLSRELNSLLVQQ